jgi:FkbM family methyltransferase
MEIDPNDWMDRAFHQGYYEPHLVELIAAIVRPGDVCLDVGAEKGFMTLHMAKAVGRGGRVIAFEPDPRAMELLRRNVEHNGFGQVTLDASALADCETVCEFALSRQLGWSSRFPNNIAKPLVASTISLRTRRLDDIVEAMGIMPETHRLSFVKIDAEGSEPLVLQGARKTLKRFRPTIHLEINRRSLYAGGFSIESVEGFLHSLDYDFFSIRFRRTGFLFQRRLSLNPAASLARDLGDCEDVLAVSSLGSRLGTKRNYPGGYAEMGAFSAASQRRNAMGFIPAGSIVEPMATSTTSAARAALFVPAPDFTLFRRLSEDLE